MIEDKTFEVTLTIRVNVLVSFAPQERDGPIAPSDAVANAIGSVDWDALQAVFAEEGFVMAHPVDGEATEVV